MAWFTILGVVLVVNAKRSALGHLADGSFKTLTTFTSPARSARHCSYEAFAVDPNHEQDHNPKDFHFRFVPLKSKDRTPVPVQPLINTSHKMIP